MSIPRRFPFLEEGDTNSILDAWRGAGFSDANTDRGLVYVDSADAGGGNIQLSAYRDIDRGAPDLVAQGTGAPSTRVQLDPQNASALTLSVVPTSVLAQLGMRLHLQLATLDDICEREDDAKAFLLSDPPEVNFDVVALATMRQFYLNFQSIYPPPQRSRDPLAFPGSSPLQVSGRRGLPDIDSVDLWRLNSEGDWEITGLQNAGDWKEWAIAWSLHLVWKRRAGSSDDPMLKRSMGYKVEARDAWMSVPVLVDSNLDRLPDRQIRTRTPKFRRG